jgi:hypothetical protein
LTSASMDVDKSQGDNSSSHGKSVSLGPVDDVTTPIFAATHINPNPTTPRGKKIVEALQPKSPELLAGSSTAGSSLYSPLQRPASSLAGLGRPASPADGAHVGSPPVIRGRSLAPARQIHALRSARPSRMAGWLCRVGGLLACSRLVAHRCWRQMLRWMLLGWRLVRFSWRPVVMTGFRLVGVLPRHHPHLSHRLLLRLCLGQILHRLYYPRRWRSLSREMLGVIHRQHLQCGLLRHRHQLL